MSDCNHNGNKSKGTCVECSIPQMARNNYFTGKLLVERDFVDEQRYFIGKERRHNQLLHGWGVVCGLKVKQHPNPACQDQYVLIEPGTAIDCCGTEIRVGREEYFDFRAAFLAAWQAQNGQNSQPDTNPHKLQICVRYRECPTEEVPALFDECGCDDSACKPNRILETYALNVLIDPPAEPADPNAVQLTWDGTVNIASAQRVALSSATKTLYVLAESGMAAALYAVNSQNGSILASQSFADNQGLDVAVSPDGSRIYVALQSSTANSDPQILVLDASNLGTTISTVAVTGGSGAGVRLAVVPNPDGRLIAANSKAAVMVWGTDINTNPSPAAPATVTVGSNPVDVAVASDGNFAYVANNGSGNVSAVSMADLTQVTTVAIGTGSAKPTALAVTSTTAGDSLAVLDHDNQTLYLIGMRPDPANAQALGNPVQGFAHHPAGVLLSSGGQWVYILEQDDTDQKAYVQSVDAHGVELQQANVLGSAVAVGNQPEGMALSSGGQKLYVAYQGDGQADPGGVAVVDVTDQDCGSLFTRILEGCPDCSTANCVVLATLNGYVFGSAVIDNLIDNLTDRRLLPSTSVIAEAVECILQHGTGSGAGLQGPQGPPGQPGTSVQSADAETIPAGQPANAQFDPNTGNIHFKIPEGADGANGTNGTNGADGAAGPGIDKVTVAFVPCGAAVPDPTLTGVSPNRTLELTIPSSCNTALTHIAGINWKHNGSLPIQSFKDAGLLIAFDGDVTASDLTLNSVKLLVSRLDDTTGARCWCEAPARLLPGNFASAGDITSAFTAGAVNGAVNGVQIVLVNLSVTPYRVQVLGDFIRDKKNNGRGVDADHLPPWLPKRATGDGIEGGTFESWFKVTQ